MKTQLHEQQLLPIKKLRTSVFLLFFLFLNTSVFSGIVPDGVQKSFDGQFPGASNVIWERQHPKGFIAEFEFQGKNVIANYTYEGNWVEAKTEISILDLPVAVKESIASFYPDWKMVVAGKIENSKNEVFYKIGIQNELKLIEVILKEEGTLLLVGLE